MLAGVPYVSRCLPSPRTITNAPSRTPDRVGHALRTATGESGFGDPGIGEPPMKRFADPSDAGDLPIGRPTIGRMWSASSVDHETCRSGR